MGTMTTQESAEFAASKQEVFDAVVRAIPTVQKMRIAATDPEKGQIKAKGGITWRSWGEDLTVVVEEVGPERTRVTVSSMLKFGLVDWGKNKRNVDDVLYQISQALASSPSETP